MTDLDPRITMRVDALRQRYSTHDSKARLIRRVREGRWDEVSPNIFSEDLPGPTVANLIDVQIRSFVASASALPSVNCASSNMASDEGKKRADKRTKIANHYLTFSDLKVQMPMAVDSYASYGLLAFSVAPDMKAQLPRIRVEDAQSVWPLWDIDMNTIAVARSFWLDRVQLETRYPAAKPSGRNDVISGSQYEIIKYEDKNWCVTYVPQLDNLILESSPNPLKKCSWVCVPRYSGSQIFDGNFRGAYDDLVWPQLMRHMFQMLAMQAADDAINAPVAVPPDVSDVPYGPGAIIRSNNPQAIRRVGIDVPQAAFQSMQWLREDMIEGGMTTEGNLGSAGGGWTTGQGQDRLGQGYDGQVALAQVQFSYGISKAIQMCFEWDELLWAKKPKEITGMEQGGSPYQLSYTAGKDINGDHSVDVRYGFLSGMDANQALVFSLQAVGGGLVSKDFARRYLPEGVDPLAEDRKITIEQLQTGLSGSLVALTQAIPQMVTQGQDPAQLIAQYAGIITDIEKGLSIQDSIAKRFAPTPPPAPQAPGEQPSPAPGSEPAGAGGASPLGVQAAPPGRPGLQMLQAALSGSGNATLNAAVSRQPQVAQ